LAWWGEILAEKRRISVLQNAKKALDFGELLRTIQPAGNKM
jgi:hypothetical protein